MTKGSKSSSMLFEEAAFGPLTVRNRIVMPAMATLFGEENGTVSPSLLAYYARRARGGAGLVIVENTAVHPQGVNYRGTLEIHDARYEDGLARLASAIKSSGAIAAIQLFHPGRQVHPKYAGNYPVAPSPIPCPVMGGSPRELHADEIRDLVRRFVAGAARAKAAGFEAIEIHGAHGYLVGQFLSPLTNARTDPYGGDTSGRARFAIEIVEGIRARLGDAFPVVFRLSADEKVAGGLTLEGTLELVPHLEAAGVTALHVSAGCYPSMEWVVQPYLQPRGCLAELAAGVRRVTDLPILTVGRINEPQVAESILAGGAADFVAMGRALIADPDLPSKALAGKPETIRPCIACNVCIEAVGERRTRCAVNPEMGREGEPAGPARTGRRVLVVGGGPAGMEAALRARSQGHRVTLVEADESLGGQLRIAGVPDSKAEIRRLLDYYTLAVERSGVELALGQELRPETVKDFQPDHVILATGATARSLELGAEDGAADVMPAAAVLRGDRDVHGDVVVIGGGLVGLDLAEVLAGRGVTVTVLEMKKHVGQELEWNLRKMKVRSLRDKGVKILTQSRVTRVDGSSIAFVDRNGSKQSIRADAIVAAVGSRPHNPLERAVRDMGFEVTCAGDCQEPRGLAEAISAGFDAALPVGFAGG